MAMAEVPEFNEIPMEYSELVEDFYTDEVSITMENNKKHLQWKHHEECWSTYLPKVKPEIRKPEKPKTSFRKVVMLVVVVEKMKGIKGIDKLSFFNDDDLLNHILVHEDITCNSAETQEAVSTQFLYSNTTVHVIRDQKQKCLTLQEFQGNAHLLALFLQGQNIQQEAKINVGTYFSAKPDAQKRPVTLGIAGRQLYLSCTAEEGTADPILCLKEVDDIKQKQNDDLLPFIFYKKTNSTRYNSFESAAFPGYYISTSQQERQQVQLIPENDQIFLRDFIMNPNL
ncbi:interleukin-1 beta-like [Anomaloglossus baeobatrachus]|uniref:interleukin-1 beta-like n=1 Tax=Anomaloglossus baeobatrachus TaxID=238106 RepID=UPI003F507528